jgi:hypothetical protein
MLNLEDLVREPSEFTLSKTGKTYRLNPCSLADESWMQRTFGKDIEKIFKEMRMLELSRLVYRLMDDESKESLAQQEVTVYDEEGVKTKQMMGGATLFQHCVVNTKEKMAIVEALLVTIGFSRPVQKELMEGLEKKSPINPSIGELSSTPSPQPTDGLPSTP